MLVYFLAIVMLLINAIFIILYVGQQLIDSPTYVQSTRGPVMSFESPDTIFNSGYVVTSVLSFILTWVATVLLLRHYSRRLGRIRYWIMVSIPLVYFLSQFQPIFLNVFSSFRLSDPVLFGIVYTLIFNATKPAGGILFGIAFWSVARSINHSTVKNYMIISAYGMVLLFISNQAILLVIVPYPPFGLATISLIGLSSYLILIGIYSSATSVAQDSKLRVSIRKSVEQQSKLLDTIGTAQMEQEIQRRVIIMTRSNQDRMTEETGIHSSLNEDDVKEYLEQVLTEVKERKNISTNNG